MLLLGCRRWSLCTSSPRSHDVAKTHVAWQVWPTRDFEMSQNDVFPHTLHALEKPGMTLVRLLRWWDPCLRAAHNTSLPAWATLGGTSIQNKQIPFSSLSVAAALSLCSYVLFPSYFLFPTSCFISFCQLFSYLYLTFQCGLWPAGDCQQVCRQISSLASSLAIHQWQEEWPLLIILMKGLFFWTSSKM